MIAERQEFFCKTCKGDTLFVARFGEWKHPWCCLTCNTYLGQEPESVASLRERLIGLREDLYVQKTHVASGFLYVLNSAARKHVDTINEVIRELSVVIPRLKKHED